MTDSLEQQIASLEQRLAAEPRSPLFARLADYYLQSGRANDALRICDQGLASYPFYTTAHLMKGKALLALKMEAEARHEFEVVHEMLPANETVAKLLTEAAVAPAELTGAIAPETHEVISTEPGIKVIKPPAKAEPVVLTPAVEKRAEPEPAQQAPRIVEKPAPPQVEPESVQEEAAAPAAELEPAVEEPQRAQEEPTVQEDAFGIQQAAAEEALVEEESSTEAQTETVEEEQAAVEVAEETSIEEVPAEVETAEAVPQDDPFGLGLQTTEEEPAVQEPQLAEEAPPSVEDAFAANFGELQMETEAAAEESVPASEAESGFGESGESLEQFAQRMRSELEGTENTLSIEEFLAGTNPLTSETEQNSIEDLAEKLQSAKKITPVINLSEKTVHTVSESETPAGTSFVTPTLAEIYVKQGWFDDAIKAYKTLAANKPADRERFEKRIKELEEQKKQQAG